MLSLTRDLRCLQLVHAIMILFLFAGLVGAPSLARGSVLAARRFPLVDADAIALWDRNIVPTQGVGGWKIVKDDHRPAVALQQHTADLTKGRMRHAYPAVCSRNNAAIWARLLFGRNKVT